MKKFSTILFIFICSVGFSQSDTLNQIGVDGKKTGYWIIYGKDMPGSGYADSSIVEQGNYIDNRKSGAWKKYFINGNLKLENDYKNNRPWGSYKKYYEIGVLQERATWKRNGYVDSFFRYYENKQLQQQKFFNEQGKQEGWSIFYLENGEIEFKGFYINGIEIKDSTYRMERKQMSIDPILPSDLIVGDSTIKNGYYKQRNNNQNLEFDGEFKNGKLFNGKHYIYDKNGLLLKIEIYKNGKYWGDGQID